MTDLHENQTPPPSPTSSTPASDPVGAAGSEHLQSLYKMSRTAGLGSTEYVAINGPAVTAAILGVASALTIFANILLVIPVVGIIFAIVALRQIAQSNGTQGGRALAWGGLVLSLLFAGIVVGGEVREDVIHSADSKQLTGIIDQLSEATKAMDVDRAYGLFAPQFQQRWDKDKFAGVLKFIHQSPLNGDLEYMKWNGVRYQFEQVPNQTDRFAAGAMLVKFNKTSEAFRTEMTFRNDGEGWKIYSIPSFFPEQQQQQAPAKR